MMIIFYSVNTESEKAMRVSQEEKDRSHARIVGSASRLFRERGIEGASVGDVMKGAGLTHGGFYRHFESKDKLLVAALEAAFGQMVAIVTDGLAKQSTAEVRRALRRFYLSDEHVENAGAGCPAAALGCDVGKAPPPIKAAFGSGLQTVIAALSDAMYGAEARGVDRTIRELSMMVGAVIIARASDPVTARQVLAACEATGAQEFIEGDAA